MTAKQPRDYQVAGCDAVWNYLITKPGNPLAALPTGTGKSLLLAMLAKRACAAYPGTRVLVLTHVKELIKNNYETLLEYWPTAPAGIYSAGLNRRDTHAKITFAGIASVHKRAPLFAGTHLVLIDECHLVSDNKSGQYASFLAALKKAYPHLRVIGVSATPWRLGLGHLTDGSMFDEVAFDVTSGEAFIWMVEQGYLSPLSTKMPADHRASLDTSSIAIRKGEFQDSSVVDAFAEQGVTPLAVQDLVHNGLDRQKWLVFASSINHCEEVVELLQDQHSIPAVAVHSRLTSKQRDEALQGFRNGLYRCVVNQNILTTGFDEPGIDLIGVLRPTKSPGLWVQMLGRGTRPLWATHGDYDINTVDGRLASIAAGEKQDCLVMDYTGNTLELGPINYPTLPRKKGKGGGEPPSRVCPQCNEVVHISIRVCPDCGYEFPVQEKVQTQASGQEVMSRRKNKQPEPEYGFFKVDKMIGTAHYKLGKPPRVKVDYYCGVRRFTAYLGPEDPPGFFKTRTERWWAAHKGGAMPETVIGILEAFHELNVPKGLRVHVNTKYPEIKNYDFTGKSFTFAYGVELDYSQGTGTASAPDHGIDRSRPASPELSDLHEFR